MPSSMDSNRKSYSSHTPGKAVDDEYRCDADPAISTVRWRVGHHVQVNRGCNSLYLVRFRLLRVIDSVASHVLYWSLITRPWGNALRKRTRCGDENQGNRLYNLNYRKGTDHRMILPQGMIRHTLCTIKILHRFYLIGISWLERL